MLNYHHSFRRKGKNIKRLLRLTRYPDSYGSILFFWFKFSFHRIAKAFFSEVFSSMSMYTFKSRRVWVRLWSDIMTTMTQKSSLSADETKKHRCDEDKLKISRNLIQKIPKDLISWSRRRVLVTESLLITGKKVRDMLSTSQRSYGKTSSSMIKSNFESNVPRHTGSMITLTNWSVDASIQCYMCVWSSNVK